MDIENFNNSLDELNKCEDIINILNNIGSKEDKTFIVLSLTKKQYEYILKLIELDELHRKYYINISRKAEE